MDYILSEAEVNALNNATTKELQKLSKEWEKMRRGIVKIGGECDIMPQPFKPVMLWFQADCRFAEPCRIVKGDEYIEARDQPEKLRTLITEAINKKCVEIATTVPIRFWGHKDARIWGCRFAVCKHCGKSLDDWEIECGDGCQCDQENWTDDDHVYAEYCDECPVQKFCNLNHHYSK